MFRSDAVDAKIWEAVVTSVIREDHLEKAVAECVRESETGPDPKELPRLEARQKQLVRAEEILLERFGRGLITDDVRENDPETSPSASACAATLTGGRGLVGAQHCVMPACFDTDTVWPDVPMSKATQSFQPASMTSPTISSNSSSKPPAPRVIPRP